MVHTKRLRGTCAGHSIFPTNEALRASSQAIDIGDVLVTITLVYAKQVYNGNIKLFNEIETFRLRFHFLFQLLVMSHYITSRTLTGIKLSHAVSLQIASLA